MAGKIEAGRAVKNGRTLKVVQVEPTWVLSNSIRFEFQHVMAAHTCNAEPPLERGDVVMIVNQDNDMMLVQRTKGACHCKFSLYERVLRPSNKEG